MGGDYAAEAHLYEIIAKNKIMILVFYRVLL